MPLPYFMQIVQSLHSRLCSWLEIEWTNPSRGCLFQQGRDVEKFSMIGTVVNPVSSCLSTTAKVSDACNRFTPDLSIAFYALF